MVSLLCAVSECVALYVRKESRQRQKQIVEIATLNEEEDVKHRPTAPEKRHDDVGDKSVASLFTRQTLQL